MENPEKYHLKKYIADWNNINAYFDPSNNEKYDFHRHKNGRGNHKSGRGGHNHERYLANLRAIGFTGDWYKWAKNKNDLKVELLGESKSNTEGIILASYNAG